MRKYVKVFEKGITCWYTVYQWYKNRWNQNKFSGQWKAKEKNKMKRIGKLEDLDTVRESALYVWWRQFREIDICNGETVLQVIF